MVQYIPNQNVGIFLFFFYVEGLILKIMQKTKALGTQNNSEKNKMEDHSIQFQGIIKLQ